MFWFWLKSLKNSLTSLKAKIKISKISIHIFKPPFCIKESLANLNDITYFVSNGIIILI